jgi:hypothetical protein
MDVTSTEQWLPVVGWEDLYEVSDHGQVRAFERVVAWGPRGTRRIVPRSLKGGRTHKGVPFVALSNGPTRKVRTIHQLVLEAFVGPKPAGFMCCHWDDDPTNNHLSNLRWDTQSANEQDKIRNGNNRQLNKTHCKRGHEFNAQNTWRDKQGRRLCRPCRVMRQRAKKLSEKST